MGWMGQLMSENMMLFSTLCEFVVFVRIFNL